MLCVQCKTPEHVEFYSKNKFEKLVHLVGFIITIYHDARSYECQNVPLTLCLSLMAGTFLCVYITN